MNEKTTPTAAQDPPRDRDRVIAEAVGTLLGYADAADADGDDLWRRERDRLRRLARELMSL